MEKAGIVDLYKHLSLEVFGEEWLMLRVMMLALDGGFLRGSRLLGPFRNSVFFSFGGWG